MSVLKLEITDDALKLISNIRFKKMPNTNSEKEMLGYEIDMYSLYGGNFLLEDMSFILGLYDKRIEGTEDDALGPRFPKEIEDKMYHLHDYIVSNLDNIEELVHQFVAKGGLTVGTYKCKDYEHIWSKVEGK